MELYNVLLVDDEADVLQAMKKKSTGRRWGFAWQEQQKMDRKPWRWQSSFI